VKNSRGNRVNNGTIERKHGEKNEYWENPRAKRSEGGGVVDLLLWGDAWAKEMAEQRGGGQGKLISLMEFVWMEGIVYHRELREQNG